MAKKSTFTTAVIVLIPVAIGINYVGKLFASLLRLPLWLDSIGTMLAGMLAGPFVGAVSGAANNVIYGVTVDPISFVYALTSVAIGLTVGFLMMKNMIKNLPLAIFSGFVVAVVAAVVSTPLNVIFWEGQTGNLWGDALFAFLMSKKTSIWLASFLDEFVVDIPDKVISMVIAYYIFKSLPKNLISLYSEKSEIEKL